MLKKIADVLKKSNKIAIFTHINPDGDALGSSFGMKRVLDSMGKNATVYLGEEMPQKFSFLGDDYIVADKDTEIFADTALVVDCATFDRVGVEKTLVENIPRILCVDHHFSGENYGDLCYKDAESPAAAQICYELSELLKDEIPLSACEAFYTGISTDTGHFKFSSVKPKTFYIASKILESGLNHRKITEILYDTQKFEKLKFTGKVAEKIELFADGKIALLKCPESFLAEYGLTYDDVEELPNIPLSIEGVKAAVLVKDKDETKKRVSLRGKDILDLSEVAEKFGGGGHKNAAAFVAEGDVDKVLDELILTIKKNLEERNV